MSGMVESYLFVVDCRSGGCGSREDGVGFRFCMWPRKDWVGWQWRCEAFRMGWDGIDWDFLCLDAEGLG